MLVERLRVLKQEFRVLDANSHGVHSRRQCSRRRRCLREVLPKSFPARGSTVRRSIDGYIAPLGGVDMTDNRPLLRQQAWARGRRHGGGCAHGGKSKPCKQGTALQAGLLVSKTPQAYSSHACSDGMENAGDTSCGNDADAYGSNSSNNANAYGAT